MNNCFDYLQQMKKKSQFYNLMYISRIYQMNKNLILTDSVISMNASNIKSNFILLVTLWLATSLPPFLHWWYHNGDHYVLFILTPTHIPWGGGVVLKWGTNLGYPYIFTPSLWPSYIVINKFSFKFPQLEYKMCTGVLMNQFQ